jgi:hypothetical protein
VLDAIAGEHLDAAIVHLHGEVDRQLTAGLAKDASQAGIEVEPVRGEVELLLRNLPGIDLRSDVFGRHEGVASGCGGTRSAAALACGPSPGRPHGARTVPSAYRPVVARP